MKAEKGGRHSSLAHVLQVYPTSLLPSPASLYNSPPSLFYFVNITLFSSLATSTYYLPQGLCVCYSLSPECSCPWPSWLVFLSSFGLGHWSWCQHEAASGHPGGNEGKQRQAFLRRGVRPDVSWTPKFNGALGKTHPFEFSVHKAINNTPFFT